jgi:hypothetical protein
VRVAWVHPTWRDLVIDRLAADAPLRRRFLSRAGPHGILLALSVAGGPTGERRLPLIAADDDWDAIGDRVYELIPELEEADLIALLDGVALAVTELGDGAMAGEARALAAISLRRSAQPWEDSHAPIGLAPLHAWLGLSRLLDPPVTPPSLAATWAELLPVAAPAPGDRTAVTRFADWLVLCRALSEFSPPLLGSLGYCRDQVALGDEFLGMVADDLEGGAWDGVLRALEAIAELRPELAARTARLMHWLRQDMPGPSWVDPVAPMASWPAQEILGPAGFDVSRVLADL